MNFIYLLATADRDSICATLTPIMTLLGYVIFAIKVIVPVILVIYGMIDLTKAIMEKEETGIKKAQGLLIKRVIVAVCVYLVITLVSLLMGLIVKNDEWKQCVGCAFNVIGTEGCTVVSNEWER